MAIASSSSAARYIYAASGRGAPGVGLASLAAFMVALDGLVVTTAPGTIRLGLGAHRSHSMESTMNAFTLSRASPGRVRHRRARRS
jgi:hypothetical protein